MKNAIKAMFKFQFFLWNGINDNGMKTSHQNGSEKANIIAEENLKNIREKVGLI